MTSWNAMIRLRWTSRHQSWGKQNFVQHGSQDVVLRWEWLAGELGFANAARKLLGWTGSISATHFLAFSSRFANGGPLFLVVDSSSSPPSIFHSNDAMALLAGSPQGTSWHFGAPGHGRWDVNRSACLGEHSLLGSPDSNHQTTHAFQPESAWQQLPTLIELETRNNWPTSTWSKRNLFAYWWRKCRSYLLDFWWCVCGRQHQRKHGLCWAVWSPHWVWCLYDQHAAIPREWYSGCSHWCLQRIWVVADKDTGRESCGLWLVLWGRRWLAALAVGRSDRKSSNILPFSIWEDSAASWGHSLRCMDSLYDANFQYERVYCTWLGHGLSLKFLLEKLRGWLWWWLCCC